MGFREEYELDFLENEAESLVFEELERQLAEDWAADICKCQDCVLDMAALALNSVKPFYRVSLLGKVYAGSLNESAYAEEVKKAVNDSIVKISVNPAHGI
ncbi:MAG: late competence development ComFB family protein [Spirochaetales bacterium]|uniref:Late competence development ComFB family protein n=1 Tax=Candidatus Thalassospirochaeta sargassi TaxID=3119039 RepID=A0AAJ1ID72_9SPIO|nr:late competence development ComFB family protein [Spirochaetales bacterium]